MRVRTMAVAVAALLVTAPCALAAPTCVDRNGDTIRCGTPGAMPVGWTPSPQQLLNRQFSRPVENHTTELLEVICGIGLLFAFIALLPDFDGSRGEDWDAQEGDNGRRD